jgi:phosphoglycerate dehydrogenase-like enzyme
MRIAVASRTFSKHPVLRKRAQEKFGDIYFNDAGKSLRGAELVEFLRDCDFAVIALEPLNQDVLSQLPRLRGIAKYGVGLNNLDLDAIQKRGIHLGWTQGVNALSVAELTLGFALGLFHNVFASSRALASGQWLNQGGFQLTGKTVGIIGGGFVGQNVLRLLQPFSCKLLVNDILDKSAECRNLDAKQVPLDELLAQSDLVSIHVPYQEDTHHLIGAAGLKAMKAGSLLINTSRGDIVDEKALHHALSSGHLAGVALDVFAVEPPLDSPLLELPGFVGTAHIGGSSAEAILAMGYAAIDRLAEITQI